MRVFLLVVSVVVAVVGAVAAIGCLGLEPPIAPATLSINLVVGYFFWLFGVLVVWYGRPGRDVVLFYAMAMALSLVILVYRPENDLGLGSAGRMAGAILSHGLYPLTVTLLLHFSIFFPDGAPGWARKVVPAFYLVSFVLSAWLVASMVAPGPRESAFLSYTGALRALRVYLPVVFLISPVVWMVKLRWAVSSTTKKKLKWLLWGMAVGIGPHLLLYELPQGLGADPLLPEEVTELVSVVAGAGILVAVARYRLLDIDTVISRSIVYIVVSALVAGAYLALVAAGDALVTGTASGSPALVRLPVVLLLALVFAPARSLAEGAVDRLFFRRRRDQRLALIELSRTASRTLDMRKLAEHIARTVCQVVGVEKVVLFASDGRGDRLVQVWPWDDVKALRSVDSSHVVKFPDGVVVLDDGRPGALDGLYLATALRTEGKLAGILAVGPKPSGEVFNDDELRFIEAVAAQTALAFSTALAFEQVRKQRDELEKRVYERTAQLAQANDRLVEQYQKLQKLDEMKETMTRMVVHDLRNPITTIAVAAELALAECEEGGSEAEVVQSLELIRETSLQLNDMAQSMLDTARIEAGTLQLRREDVDISRLLSTCAGRMRILAGTRHVGIEVKAAQGVTFRLDRELMERVVTNLLANAIRHAKTGGRVVLSCRTRDDRCLEIWVTNDGPAIPPEVRPRIFDRFFQVTDTRRGAGLGLHFCRMVCRAHGGDIDVISPLVGRTNGARFVITLPAS